MCEAVMCARLQCVRCPLMACARGTASKWTHRTCTAAARGSEQVWEEFLTTELYKKLGRELGAGAIVMGFRQASYTSPQLYYTTAAMFRAAAGPCQGCSGAAAAVAVSGLR